MTRSAVPPLTLLFVLLLLDPPDAAAQGPGNVLLVLNEASPISLEVGQYYREKRGVPSENVLRLKTATADEISRAEFQQQVEAPIAAWMGRTSGHDRILYLVLTKGIPLRVTGSSGAKGTAASVDSELALLYRRMAGIPVPEAGWVANPYFAGELPIARAQPFTHRDHDFYLVTRLDGYTSGDIRGLIDRGVSRVRDGSFVLDARSASSGKGDDWLATAGERLRAQGFGDRVILDRSERVLQQEKAVLGYYSWGSNDPAIRMRHFGFGFVPGALAGMFVSSDGRTFEEPPATWQVGSWEEKSPRFAGSPQSLAGDLIREGVTGIAAHVAEPYLEGTIRPQILFPAYAAGLNLAESFYLAMPFLSWQTVVVGDPLCAPFRERPLASDSLDPKPDPETELPSFFSARRVRAMSLPAYQKARVHPDAIKALMRAEVRVAKGDRDGAREALEEATARDSRAIAAQAFLASLYEQSRDYDRAIERYRRILEMTPDDPMALNNLAYALAVHKDAPQEALPLAERARGLAMKSPNIADTLGWIHHLLGKNDTALPLVEEASREAPQNALIHLHAAAVAAETGNKEAAERHLNRALELDAALEAGEETKKVRAKLNSLP